MATLSLLAEAVKKMKGAKSMPISAGLRTPIGPAQKGMVRGTRGATGARLFQGRNSMKGEQQNADLVNSPIMQSYLKQSMPSTPITDFLRRRGL